ncbi:MAG TPA: zinc ribbon domain-containing protein [Nocardioides sp.]|nr:zinc ribbon domain-containing protein [Nocardioides sp.]
MSTTQHTPPGIRGQQGARLAFRVVGLVLLVVALGLLAVGLQDLFASGDSFEGPHRFWMVFVGVLMLGPAGWCLQAGFLGAASRYVAGETTPVLKDSAAYLSDGEGILGVGRTVDDQPPARQSATPPATGPFCSKCGVRNDADASFCDGCGAALAH